MYAEFDGIIVNCIVLLWGVFIRYYLTTLTEITRFVSL